MLYTTEGIILAKTEIRDREQSYTILTRDFWKISGFYRENPKTGFSDVGTRVDIGIERKGETNRFRSIKTLENITHEALNFEDVSKYLLLLQFCRKQIPDGGGDGPVYQDFASLIGASRDVVAFRKSVFLFEVRMLTLFQSWPSELLQDPILRKLEPLSEHHALPELLLVQGIPDSCQKTVHSAFLQSFLPWTSSTI